MTGVRERSGTLQVTSSSRIVHDHKGNVVVEWLDAPSDYERQRAPGQKTDLRKLSAWIKMMRPLEEARKNRDQE